MYDTIIKNGTIIDGLGTSRYQADVAIKDGYICKITQGITEDKANSIIDATGLLVTPGWVDVHTHYDAQATWDPTFDPSSGHGVTTVIMGSCGVGFAPVKPEKRDWLIALMEGVEDIPGAAMVEGIKWGWETFPEYLDILDKQNFAVDVGCQVPHGAVRGYVMGERGAANETATDDDIAAMRTIVAEGLKAGAFGFSTSRTIIHKALDGRPMPGTFAEEKEVFGIAQAIKDAGHGLVQLASQHETLAADIKWLDRLSTDLDSVVCVNFSQIDSQPNLWREILHYFDTRPDSSKLYAQVSGRAIGIVMGWSCTAHPFATYPTWLNELMHMDPIERRQKLLSAEMKEQLLSEQPISIGPFEDFITQRFDRMFVMDSSPNYEPEYSDSIAGIAERSKKTPQEVAYDYLCKSEGLGLLYFPLFNYADGNIESLREMILNPRTRIGLGDGGAHCGAICDSSIPTSNLTFWTRDRHRGEKFSVEEMVKKQTSETADLFGLGDRGRLKEGLKADINLIDYDNLKLQCPKVVYDLPAGGRRIVQRAEGYVRTLKSGVTTFKNGVHTGQLPGGLLRGPR
jgi:N-acyl-D-aspartate/D-glutamate deacylase